MWNRVEAFFIKYGPYAASSEVAGFVSHSMLAAFWMAVSHRLGHPLWVALLVGGALPAWKEYWFDARYELPKQELRGSTIDFSEYLLGLFLGWVVSWQ